MCAQKHTWHEIEELGVEDCRADEPQKEGGADDCVPRLVVGPPLGYRQLLELEYGWVGSDS